MDSSISRLLRKDLGALTDDDVINELFSTNINFDVPDVSDIDDDNNEEDCELGESSSISLVKIRQGLEDELINEDLNISVSNTNETNLSVPPQVCDEVMCLQTQPEVQQGLSEKPCSSTTVSKESVKNSFRGVLWKNTNLEYRNDIEFTGISDLPEHISKLETPYQFFHTFLMMIF